VPSVKRTTRVRVSSEGVRDDEDAVASPEGSIALCFPFAFSLNIVKGRAEASQVLKHHAFYVIDPNLTSYP
jgi:hypothetical protein